MTEPELTARAVSLWGPRVRISTVMLPPGQTGCLVAVDGLPGVHRLDGEGRVACGHPLCLARQMRAEGAS